MYNSKPTNSRSKSKQNRYFFLQDIMKARLAAQAAQQQQHNQQVQQASAGTSGASSMPQAPSPFASMQQQNSQQQFQNSRPMSATTPNDNGMSVSTPQTVPPPASSGPSPSPAAPTTNGPQSTTSTPSTPLVPSLMTPNQTQVPTANKTPPHPATTPSPLGLASLGKGMTSQERAALNAPRNTSMSSQMAAITAALDRDNSPSPPHNSNKGNFTCNCYF